jgi:hypothetical protein
MQAQSRLRAITFNQACTVFLGERIASAAASSSEKRQPPEADRAAEVEFWRSVEKVSNKRELQAYLDIFKRILDDCAGTCKVVAMLRTPTRFALFARALR